MSLDSTHPLYEKYHDDWVKMRDCYGGETVIKSKATTYLPATAGMIIDAKEQGSIPVSSLESYKSYLRRAVYHGFISDAIEAMIGFMHRKPAKIEVPKAMETLIERATVNGESLQLLLRRINEQQLVAGRLGIMADMPAGRTSNPDLIPYIATYTAENIRNWDDDTGPSDVLSNLNLVILDESGSVRADDFTWRSVTRYRVMVLGQVDENEGENSGAVYSVGVFDNMNDSEGVDGTSLRYDASKMIEPQFRGRSLTQLPFVLINAKDIVPTPDDPPLLDLANLSLAVYRGEADYRESLHKQGQDTLVITGATHREGEEAWRIGAGSSIELDMGGDAKFIGVSSEGLPEQRTSLENDKRAAAQKSSILLDTNQGHAESGDALGIRVAARTATLTQLAQAGAAGLEKLLRIIAEWIGANPDEVHVTPNLEFAEGSLSGQDMVQIMTARTLGFPISKQTIHALAQDRGITKLSYEDEIQKIGEEDANAGNGGGGTQAGGDPSVGA